VKTIIRMVAGGMSVAEILAEHPDLEEEDVRQALEFAEEAQASRACPAFT
jgi:uncharacterized protein (DUF433 family)